MFGSSPGRLQLLVTRLSLALTMILCSLTAWSQTTTLSESIDVRVVNFEVIVTDEVGNPVRGLSRSDFELLVDGELTGIDYFSAVENGVPVDDAAENQDEGESVLSDLDSSAGESLEPLLVVVFDGRDLDPGWSVRTAEEVASHLGDLTESTRGVMVVRQGTTLETEQVFTTDSELLASALERAGMHRPGALAVRERDALVRDVERATPPEFASSEGDALQIQAHAEVLLRQIKSYQQLETYALERSVAQLRSLVRSMAGLPGRKELLYLGRGFKEQPAEPLFELWWSKFSSIGPSMGVNSIQTEMGLETVNRKLLSLIEEANAHKITFNTYAPGGIRSAGAATQFSDMRSAALLDLENDRQRQFLTTLARSTGGVSEARQSVMAPLLGEMISGFRYFYSLGFDVEGELTGPGKVEVRVPDGDYRVRHLDQYRVKPAARTLEDLTLSALVTNLTENPLDLTVDIDSPERQKRGTYLVPILVKVPISKLALLPEASKHVGKLTLVVQAQSAEGNLSSPVRGEIPIEIDNRELLSALSGSVGYRLKMIVSEGEQKIAVAVRDEIGRTEAALNLIINPGGGS